MNAVVKQMFKPDIDAMRSHVEHLFGGFLYGCHDGLIELAWTDTQPDASGRYRLRYARMFGTDQLDELVDEAARLNATPMCNVYIGAALRRPDTPPFGRGEDKDVLALTAAYTDQDEQGSATGAKSVYERNKPTLVVVTGSEPFTRAQLWWRLEEPCTDPALWPDMLRGMALAMGGDTTVTNPSRVMRLAGSIAWPVKDGRRTELTRIAPLKEPGPASYMVEHLTALFPPQQAGASGPVNATEVQRTTNGLGLQDKIADGRERYMRDTVLACLIEFIGENGAAPSAQDLFDAAWPQYERHVDLNRSGRGPEEFAEKCRYTVQRFERGDLRGLETLERAVEVAQRKRAAADGARGAQADRPAGAGPQEAAGAAGGGGQPQPATIATVDFMTLYTEEVEDDPDYIEPGFAGPGSFVLVAGPPKAQKSFLLQEMLVAAATGGGFLLNTFQVPRPLRVFYLQAEMNRKLLRQRAREMAFLTPDQRANLRTNLIMSERFHMILNENGVQTAVATIRAAFPDAPPDIIAVDPLANVFDQENENDNAQIMRFLTGRLEAVRQAVNPLAAIVLVHHSTKKSTEDLARDPFVAIRGGGALRGYYDSAIVIYRESEESKSRRVHFELRGGESPEPITVELVGGRFQATSVLSSIDKPMARKILQAIDDAWKKGTPWSLFPQSKREGRHAGTNAAGLFNVSEKAAEALIEQWLLNGVVTHRHRVFRQNPAGLERTGSID
ncbi:AAA family ATPase [Xanthobacter autotrophicus]|uniref:AAA family ATPase n=1 Tax=Xanthobacter autotrophicus TaxID=280 RepID=UPI00372A1138